MTHAYTFIFVAGGETITKAVSKTGEAEYVIELNVPASTTNQQIALALDVSQAVSVYLFCDTAITLKTNSTGAPAATITLAAGLPKQWVSDLPAAENPFGTTDVTTLYATTGAVGSGGANLTIKILVDPTP